MPRFIGRKLLQRTPEPETPRPGPLDLPEGSTPLPPLPPLPPEILREIFCYLLPTRPSTSDLHLDLLSAALACSSWCGVATAMMTASPNKASMYTFSPGCSHAETARLADVIAEARQCSLDTFSNITGISFNMEWILQCDKCGYEDDDDEDFIYDLPESSEGSGSDEDDQLSDEDNGDDGDDGDDGDGDERTLVLMSAEAVMSKLLKALEGQLTELSFHFVGLEILSDKQIKELKQVFGRLGPVCGNVEKIVFFGWALHREELRSSYPVVPLISALKKQLRVIEFHNTIFTRKLVEALQSCHNVTTSNTTDVEGVPENYDLYRLNWPQLETLHLYLPH